MSGTSDSPRISNDTKTPSPKIIRKIFPAVIVGLGVMGSVSGIIHLLWQKLQQYTLDLDSVRAAYSSLFQSVERTDHCINWCDYDTIFHDKLLESSKISTKQNSTVGARLKCHPSANYR